MSEGSHGRRVTVMGLGQFGGGLGAVQYFLERGARVTVTDLQTEERLRCSLDAIDPARLERLVLGEHRLEDFSEADLVVVNPGVRRRGNRFLEAASEAGIPLTSEMNLFWEQARGRKLAVTGTVGKSTTASLIHHCLASSGRPARLGGNIGSSLLPEVDEIGPDEWLVLELSSFQLSDLNGIFSPLSPVASPPEVAVVTNFHANHLDWHGGLEAYRSAKQSLLRRQRGNGLAVLNADDPDVSTWETPARTVWFGTESGPGDGVRIEGDRFVLQRKGATAAIERSELSPALGFAHLRHNVAAALAAVTIGAGLDLDDCRPALGSFAGLPHRLQPVGRVRGRLLINDSKATTPEATLAAITSLECPLVLIAGGRDKGIDLAPLADAIARRTRGAALIGATASTLSTLVTARNPQLPLVQAATLEQAVRWALAQAASGETVLLSPGCGSDGEFINYVERGRAFENILRDLDDPAGRAPSAG